MGKKILYMVLFFFSAIAGAQQALRSGTPVTVQDVVFCNNETDSRVLLGALQSGGPDALLEEFNAMKERDHANNTYSCAVPPSPVEVIILDQVDGVSVADKNSPRNKVMWYIVAVRMEGSLYYIITRQSVIPYSTPKGYYRVT